jgi:hypothetical protein
MRRLARYLIPLVSLFAIVGMLRVLEAATTLSGLVTLPSPTMIQPGAILTGQALRLGETTTVDPRTGSGVQRPVASILYARDGSTAYEKTGSTSTAWEVIGLGSVGAGSTRAGFLTARAASLTGISTSLLTCWREEFADNAPTGFATILAGTGTSAASANNDVGSHWLLSTGATAASRVRFGTNGNVIGRPDTAKFYGAFRFAVTTAIDAQTQMAVGFTNISLAGVQFGPGICGPLSTGFYVFQYDATTLVTCGGTNVVTTVPVSTAQHLWEVWGVGDNKLHFAADGAELGNSPVTQAAAGTSSLRWQTDTLNNATAASRVTDLDFVQVCWSET